MSPSVSTLIASGLHCVAGAVLALRRAAGRRIGLAAFSSGDLVALAA